MRPLFLTFLAGALLAVGFAPFDGWAVGFVSLSGFFLLLQRALTLRQSLWRGFFYGYGHAIAGTYWIANSLLVDSAQFGWLYPISVLGLSAVMALWFALLGALMFWLRHPTSPSVNWLRFAVFWVIVEYLRSLGMFGFPWNLLGTMALAMPPLAQFASLVGSYGLSLLLALLFTLPALMDTSRVAPPSARQWRGVILLALFTLAGVEWATLRGQPALFGDQRIRIVQANIPQAMKWTPMGAVEAERLYSNLSTQPPMDGATTVPSLIIWPETAVPVPLRRDSYWPKQVGALAPAHGVILTGAQRVDRSDGRLHLYNSLLAINHQGSVQAVYDKHQLVPFGEFVPLRETLPLEKITPGTIDFSRGGAPTAMMVGDDIPAFRPLICYEVIFPWLAATPPGERRADWLVNITNDGWYGNAPGPYQHLAAARMRAIEQGLPLVRAANTGISAIIDPYGRLTRALPLNARGIIDAPLPQQLPPTFYSRWGELPTLLAMLLLMLIPFCKRSAKNSAKNTVILPARHR